jgi:hypothetical protein
MKVFLTSVAPNDSIYNVTYLRESYKQDPFKIHQVVENPEEADIIIFAELHPPSDPFFFKVLTHKLYRKYKNKCYLYHDNYVSLTFLPTITPVIEQRHYNPILNQPFSYLVHLAPNNYVKGPALNADKKFLFSFVGAAYTHQLRKRMMNIKYERCYLSDTHANSWDLSPEEKDEYAKNYARISFESKFILCPRGKSPNSYRLYESMKMGIVPVIISDEWVPTVGPDWETFSIRILEKDIENIHQILEKREAEASKMGQLARQAWLDWFAKDKLFHYLTEACAKLHNSRNKLNFYVYLKQYMLLFEPFYSRNFLRYLKNRMIH